MPRYGFLLCVFPAWGLPNIESTDWYLPSVWGTFWLSTDPGVIPGWKRSPGGGNGNLLQYSGESHGQRRLAGYSPWGHKELDMTKWLTFPFLYLGCWAEHQAFSLHPSGLSVHLCFALFFPFTLLCVSLETFYWSVFKVTNLIFYYI